MTKPKKTTLNRQRHVWSLEELATLRQRYPDTLTATLSAEMGISVTAIVYKCSRLGIKKSTAYISKLSRIKSIGVLTRFKPGNVPFNRGLKGWQAGGRSAETRYKAGNRNYNRAPLGAERMNVGYLQRKMTETGYPPRDWVNVHHLVWREAGREIPRGFRLVFKDGNTENITLDNLELVSMAELMRRNSCHNHGPDVGQLIQLRGAINRIIHNKEKAA